MSRLDILRSSLQKKETKFNDMLDNHFNDVKSANGQPLNDKRNGRQTLNRWEKQNNSLRNQKKRLKRRKMLFFTKKIKLQILR